MVIERTYLEFFQSWMDQESLVVVISLTTIFWTVDRAPVPPLVKDMVKSGVQFLKTFLPKGKKKGPDETDGS
jgi:hypothetical protein